MTQDRNKTDLILPYSKEGIPNLEIRRMQRKIEEETPERTIHEQTLEEISKKLDHLQDLTQRSRIRGLFLVATLTKEEPHDALTLFGVPRPEVEKGPAHELLQYAAEWFAACAHEVGPPDPPASS